MKVTGRTRARTPYTQQYIDRRGFAPMVSDLDDRMARLELAPRGIKREQSILDVDIVAGGPPGPPGGSFPHLIISPTHTDTGGVPFPGALLTYNGTIWTPVAAAGDSAIFGYDYIIDAAYTGVDGATATTVNGHIVRLYATIGAALAHAATLGVGSNRSFLIAGGTYNEAVTATPPSSADWAIHGVSSSVVKWTATANSQRLLDLGSLAGGSVIEVKGIHFDLNTRTSAFGLVCGVGFLGEVTECMFSTGGATTSASIWLTSAPAARITDCDFDGSGIGIRGAGSVFRNTVIGNCTFRCAQGISAGVFADVSIEGSYFDCSSSAISAFNGMARVTITGCTFKDTVSLGSLVTDQLTMTGNTFDVASGVIGLNFSGVSSTSEGFTITGNTFKGTGTAQGIALDTQMASGIIANNTFDSFTLGNEITGTGGANLDIFHNISDAGVMADQGSPVGHTAGGVSTHNLLDGVVHLDTRVQGVSRGSLIAGMTGTAGGILWDELVIGPLDTYLHSSGVDATWQYMSGTAIQTPHATGRFYSSPLNTTLDTAALAANTLYAIPFCVPATKTYTSINIEVTTLAAAAAARLGIYRDLNGAPSARVLDAGTVSVTTTGLKTIAISQALTPGWYWLVLVSDGAPSVRGLPASALVPWLGFTSGTDVTMHPAWSVAFTYAALPDPFTGDGALMTASAPRLMLGL